jgi:hypothetical protein
MLKQGLRIRRIFYDLASNPWVILGTSRNGLGDRWHIAGSTEKNSANLPALAYRPNHCVKCYSRQIRCRVIAKSAGSGESVFTLMDVVLYGLLHYDG